MTDCVDPKLVTPREAVALGFAPLKRVFDEVPRYVPQHHSWRHIIDPYDAIKKYIKSNPCHIADSEFVVEQKQNPLDLVWRSNFVCEQYQSGKKILISSLVHLFNMEPGVLCGNKFFQDISDPNYDDWKGHVWITVLYDGKHIPKYCTNRDTEYNGEETCFHFNQCENNEWEFSLVDEDKKWIAMIVFWNGPAVSIKMLNERDKFAKDITIILDLGFGGSYEYNFRVKYI